MKSLRWLVLIFVFILSVSLCAAEEPQQMPQAKNRVAPNYPALLKAAGIEGEVVVRVMVNEQGGVDDVVTLRASNPDFVPATLDAVKQWTFIPASRDGKPIKAEVTIPFKFKLGEGGYKSGYEDLMKLKENTVQLVQGKTTEEILSQIDAEAYIVIGNRMEHLPGLVRDKGKRGLLLEGPESKVVSTRLKADFSVDSAFLVLVTKPDSTSAERYHTIVFFKSEAGNWKIYAWHTSLRR
jgi:TonB family protein